MNIRELNRKVCIGFFAYFLTATSLANPVGGSVASGNISIQQTPNVTTINQTSNKGIINWQSFNIGANQATHFIQPAGGVTLNRINPTQGASQIYGVLTATGRILLINPAGIYFGPNSYVNVGGLIASTSNISDQNFLSDKYSFTPVNGFNGSIVNDGTIIAAQHGLVALLGNSVQNNGMIEANLGTAALGSGRAFSLTFSGNDLISFTVDEGSIARGIDKDGNSFADGVKNTGKITANGGRVLVSAKAAAGILDNAINMQGIIQAQSVSKDASGSVILSAGKQGNIKIAANIDVTGKNVGLKGGKVKINGENLLFDANTIIDVSGDTGGGSIQIGRDDDGFLVKSTQFKPGVKLLANAISSGNGGFIETSGEKVNVNGLHVDTSSTFGKSGMWVLDPIDVTICDNCTTTDTEIAVTDLVNYLGFTSIIIYTVDGGVGGNGDIIVNTPITWDSSNYLKLTALRNLNINYSITNTGGADLILQADNSGTGIGTVTFAPGAVADLSGGSGKVSIYYNPTTFGVQDTLYTGGTAPNQYMLIHSLGNEGDNASARTLAALSNNSALWNQNFALSKDIDASATSSWNGGLGFSPIGDNTTSFSGLFDGLGKHINFLTINRPASSDIGLFGVTSSSAKITTLGLNAVNIVGNGNVGALVGNNAGAIDQVFSTGKVRSNADNAGGLVGLNSGTLSDVYSHASVVASTAANVGGLVGQNLASGVINNAYTLGYTQGNSVVGGLVGLQDGTLQNSFWNTESTGLSDGIGGGIGNNINIRGGCFYGFFCDNGGDADLTASYTFADAGWDVFSANPIWTVFYAFYPILSKTYTEFTEFITVSVQGIKGNLSPVNSIDFSLYPNIDQTVAIAGTNGLANTGQTGADGSYNILLRGNTLTNDSPFVAYVKDSPTTKGYTYGFADNFFSPIQSLNISPNAVRSSVTAVPFGFDVTICDACTIGVTNSGLNLPVSDLVAMLNLGNTRVSSDLFTLNPFLDNSDIFINAPITWSSGNLLELRAPRDIVVNENIVNTGGASLVLRAGDGFFGPGTGLGLVSFAPGKNVTLSGGSGTVSIFNGPAAIISLTSPYVGGTAPILYFTLNSLGQEGDTTTPTLASLANNPALWSSMFRFSLGSDIDASATRNWNGGLGFSPIGNLATAFSSTLDGQHHIISNLYINRPSESNVGLFGVTDANAQIKNVGVSGATIVGNNNVGALVGNNGGTLEQVFSTGKVIGQGNNVGGLVGINSGTLNRAYSYASAVSAANNVGGLVGQNTIDGFISETYAIGYTSGNSLVGGLVGLNDGILGNSFWDTDHSGQTVAIGGGTGIDFNVAGGCLGGVCTNGGTADLSDFFTFLNAGWSFNWSFGVTEQFYPYFLSTYGYSPNIITGKLHTTNSFSNTLYPNVNQTIGLLFNGGLLDSTQTGANGNFYFLEKPESFNFSVGAPLLLFVKDSATTKGNTITLNGGINTNVPILPNTVLVADNPSAIGNSVGINTYDLISINKDILGITSLFLRGLNLSDADIKNAFTNNISPFPIFSGEMVYNFLLDPAYASPSSWLSTDAYASVVYVDQNGYHFLPQNVSDSDYAQYTSLHGVYLTPINSIISNDSLASVLGSTTGDDFLYTASGSDIDVKPGNHFETKPNVQFALTGNLSTTDGSIIFGGPVQVGPVPDIYNPNVTVKTNNSGDIKTMDLVTWGGRPPVIYSNDTLKLDSAGSIFINKPIIGVIDDLGGNIYTNGNLILSAANADQSITTSLLGRIFVNNFTLLQGKWYQNDGYLITPLHRKVGVQAGDLLMEPLISANNFHIGPNAEFIRNMGGDGTLANPYLIGDLFGLQGIGSSARTLSSSYKVANYYLGRDSLSIFSTRVWNNGAGFVPIGNSTTPFSGTFDGQFGNTISIIQYLNIDFDGEMGRPLLDNIGLFGVTSPTAVIKNLILLDFTVTGNNNVGALVGDNHGTISNVFANQLNVAGNSNVGGLVGLNSGNIFNTALVSGFISGSNYVGGLVGRNLLGSTIDKTLTGMFVVGNNYLGGIAGANAGTITNSFWNVDYSGQKYPTTNPMTGIPTSLATVYGGCFNGDCKNTIPTKPTANKVNLFSDAPYLAAGWEFNNSDFGWKINPGKSYPYPAGILGMTGIPGFGAQRVVPNIIAEVDHRYGFHPSVYQVVSGAIGPITGVQPYVYITLTSGQFAVLWTGTTGADGSFYQATALNWVYSDSIATFIGLVGGNNVGGAIIPTPGVTGSLANIKIPAQSLSSFPGNPQPLSAFDLFAFFSGVDPEALIKSPNFNIAGFFFSNNLVTQYITIFQRELSQSYLQYLNSAINAYNFIDQGDGVYTFDMEKLDQFVKENMKDLSKQTSIWNQQFLKRYDIKLAKPNACVAQ